jgi:hypothetical protein
MTPGGARLAPERADPLPALPRRTTAEAHGRGVRVMGDPDDIDEVSPPDLGERADEIINGMWERFVLAATPEEERDAIAEIVFHARHFRPEDHAAVARAIRHPMAAPRGRPEKRALREDCAVGIAFGLRSSNQRERARFVAELARRHATSKEVVRRALRAAEEERDRRFRGK